MMVPLLQNLMQVENVHFDQFYPLDNQFDYIIVTINLNSLSPHCSTTLPSKKTTPTDQNHNEAFYSQLNFSFSQKLFYLFLFNNVFKVCSGCSNLSGFYFHISLSLQDYLVHSLNSLRPHSLFNSLLGTSYTKVLDFKDLKVSKKKKNRIKE